LRHWQKPSGLTPTGSKKLSTQWAKPHCDANDEGALTSPFFIGKAKIANMNQRDRGLQ